MPSGAWGDFDWGDQPWGTSIAPPSPETANTIPGSVVIPRGAGELCHEFIGPAGTDFPEYVGNFEYIKEAPGGYMSASGTIEALRAISMPGVYVDGAVWKVTLRESGREVWRGYLQDPAISGGKATLKADGTGRDPERTFGRLAYQIRAYDLFSGGSGDPYNLLCDEDVIKLDIQGGHILFTVDEDATVSNNDTNHAVLWVPKQNNPTRVAFTIKDSSPTELWRIQTYTAKGPSGTLTTRAHVDLTDPTQDVDFDVSSADNDDLLTIALLALSSFTSIGFTVEITNLRVNFNGVPGDVMTTSQLAADLIGRMGFSTAHVHESGQNGLPFDTGSEDRAESLDRLGLLTDWRWLAFGDYIEFAPWNTRVWTVIDPEMPVDLHPLPRFDQIVVPYKMPNSTVTQEEPVTSPTPLLKSRSFGAVSLPEPAADKEAAQALGQQFLEYLMTIRFGGDGEVSEVLDAFGNRRPAHDMEAGDTMFFPIQRARGRIKSLRGQNGKVGYTLDDRLAVVEKVIARRTRRMMVKGLA